MVFNFLCLFVLQVYKTKVVKKTLNPKWHQSHLFSISSLDIPVKFTVYDYDEYSEQKFMGTATLLIDFLEYYGSGKPTEVIKLPLTYVLLAFFVISK